MAFRTGEVRGATTVALVVVVSLLISGGGSEHPTARGADSSEGSAGAADGTGPVSPGATTYLVSFDETPLANGVTWFVNVTGFGNRSASVTSGGGNVIEFELPNGTYGFSASTAGSDWTWDMSLTGPSFTVAGAAKEVPVYFQYHGVTPLYEVEFAESGLPTGSNFIVLVDGRNLTGVAPTTLSIDLANGSYSYSVPDETPYIANDSGGELVVHGHSETVAISFSTSSPPGFSILPWAELAGALGAVVAAIFVFRVFARRRKREGTGSPSEAGSSIP